MIRTLVDGQGNDLVTCDQWHVIHAEWSRAEDAPQFVRTIVSEHESRAAALRSGRRLKSQLASQMKSRPRAAWDQVMVRSPRSETIKVAGRTVKPEGRQP